ncbi:thioredoxine 2 [Gorgonomyces haynaldii]|nr:thioredoxine 2 [Gorgonomyces haynaldii]
MVHVIASAQEFNDFVNQNPLVIVDYFATWCGPCKVISPKFAQFSETYTSIKFIKVDVDDVPEVAEAAGIRAMPTFQLFKDGKMVEEVVGADPNKLEAIIKKYA